MAGRASIPGKTDSITLSYPGTYLCMSADAKKAVQPSFPKKPERVRNFFLSPFFLSITIGLPFCMFKLLFGICAVRVASGEQAWLFFFGLFIICWASVDLAMNIGRAGLDIAKKPAPFEYCTIAQAGRMVQMPYVFLAFDTFLSFAIICFMLWSGWIGELTLPEAYVWYTATTLNLISLSVVSLYSEIWRLSARS